MKSATVVLLHGTMRTRWSMWPMQRALQAAGYAVVNETYPSRTADLARLAAGLERELSRRRVGTPLHFVTHSMGGLIARAYLARPEAPEVQRVVMIAPPNQGAVEADWASRYGFLRWVFGPTLDQMRSSGDCVRLPPPRCSFGIIAGGRGQEPGFSPRIPGDNDGRVRVAETHLPGLADFVLVRRRHTFIMQAPEVIAHTLAFLQTGRFRY